MYVHMSVIVIVVVLNGRVSRSDTLTGIMCYILILIIKWMSHSDTLIGIGCHVLAH